MKSTNNMNTKPYAFWPFRAFFRSQMICDIDKLIHCIRIIENQSTLEQKGNDYESN